MLSRIRFLLFYFVFWIGCFEGGRVLFLLYEWRNTARLTGGVILTILAHGLVMDVSLACLMTLLPLCVVARAGFLPEATTRRIVLGYTIAALAFSAIITVADLEVFSVWGYRLDSSPFHYLKSSHEAFASASASPLLLLALILVVVFVVGAVVFSHSLLPYLSQISAPTQLHSFALLALVTPLLTIGGRGGLDWRISLTEGSVYFSRNNFANQAALNPVWSFLSSVKGESNEGTIARFADRATVDEIVDSLVASPLNGARAPRFLKSRPRKIIILFWEGFTAKIVEPMGGLKGITPHFTSLATEGILFDRIYASGPRTTNGLVAVLAGFPSHPTNNPLQSLDMSAALPRLSVSMARTGYRTGFYYGAPLAFDNRNGFLFDGHYDEIVEKKDFDRSAWQSPWGVHDPQVLDRLFHAVDSATTPIWAVTLTLSSHEPYDVPGPPRVRGIDADHRFLNAQAFTDEAVFRFVRRAQQTPWWDSTLMVIVADHGSPRPYIGSPLASSPQQYRIPMLWLGGALAVRDTVVHRIGSQSDITSTLLTQLGIGHDQYRWSRDFLAPGAPEFAYYSFRNGFGYVDRSGSYVFDNVARAMIDETGKPTPASLRAGRAFQQGVMQAYRDLSAPRAARLLPSREAAVPLATINP